jgi:hypothetical protein
VGRNHPDRNALTSVLIGEAIERIDCPDRPFHLKNNDILIVASDGLQFLSDTQITEILIEHAKDGSSVIAETLLDELRELGDPEQDNVCFSVIRVEFRNEAAENANIFAPEFDRSAGRPRQVTTRPIAPSRSAEAEHEEAAAVQLTHGRASEAVAAGMNGLAKKEKSEAKPIFLRRRWLATDGGA